MSQKKIDVQKTVLECQKIVAKYLKEWKPENKQWKTIEGCAYLRLSTDDQVLVEKGSLEQQVYLAIAEATYRSKQHSKNYKITQFYIDAGISGRRGDRKDFMHMKRAIRREDFKFVVFKEIARIARDSKIWKEFFQLCQSKNCEIVIRGLPIDPNDPASTLQLDILAAFAEYEANQTSKRIRDSVFSAMVNNGKFNSTHKRLGLEPLVIAGERKVGFYQPNAEEMKTVIWIMETFVKYGSHQKTLEECNRRGIKNVNGRLFTRNSLITLLTDSRYIGKWYLNEENRNEDQELLKERDQFHEIDLPHGSLISTKLWIDVQHTVKQVCGNRGKNTRVKRVYPLSAGLLQYHDGTRFYGANGNGKTTTSYYYYNRENGIRIKAALVESDAMKTVSKLIKNSPELQHAIRDAGEETQDNIQFLKQRIEQIKRDLKSCEQQKEDQLKNLSILTGSGSSPEEIQLFRKEFKTLLERINGEKEELQQQLSTTEKELSQLKNHSFSWKDIANQAQKVQEVMLEYDPVVLKNAMHTLFKSIVVGPEDEETGTRVVTYKLNSDLESIEDEVRHSSGMVEALSPP